MRSVGCSTGALQNTPAEICLLLMFRYGLAVSEIFTRQVLSNDCIMQQVIQVTGMHGIV